MIAGLRGALSPDGLICRMAAMDVTEQRLLESEAREKNEDLDRIFTLSHDLLAIIGPDGRFRRVNPAFERVLGYSPALLATCDLLRLVHPDDLEATRHVMERLKEGREVLDFVNRYRSSSGSFRWLEWRITPYGEHLMCAVARDITERKEAEDALRESEERLRLFIEHAPAGIAMLDREIRYLAASNRWKEDYGLSGDVTGRSHIELFPNFPEHWRQALQRCLAGETVREDEDEIRRADGSMQCVRWEGRPWRVSGGGIGGILIAAEDITERVRSREALRESEKRLRLAIDAAQMGSWDWNLQTNEVIWNARHEIILGYEPGTPLRTFNDFVARLHPEDAQRVQSRLRQAIDRDTDYSCDFRSSGPTAASAGFPVWAACFTIPDGRPARMLGMIMDITDRAEAAAGPTPLRREVPQHRRVLALGDASLSTHRRRPARPDGGQSGGRQGAWHRPRPAPRQARSKMRFPICGAPGSRESTAPSPAANSSTQQFEIDHHEGGVSGCFEVYVFQTNPGTIAVVLTEISERRKAREALEKYQEELESRVDAQLRTRQLRALADELTHAEERERRRIAGLIHEDLQQTLVAALINLGMLKSRVADAESEREFTQVEGILRDSIQTARSLTAELSPPVLQQCGLAAALKWLRTWCGEKYSMDVRVEVDEEEDVQGDAGVSLFRCVSELLFNIVKHAGVRTAELRMWRGDGDLVRIQVQDQGSGFDPGEVRAREGPVGGFGLFSIRERLETLGGGLEIESSPGSGSRFTLWVPERKSKTRNGKSDTITARIF